jgi:hypothetical protein
MSREIGRKRTGDKEGRNKKGGIEEERAKQGTPIETITVKSRSWDSNK